GLDGVDRPQAIQDVAGADVEQAAAGAWRRDAEDGHTAELPQRLALQVVRAHLARARRHDLGPLPALPDKRRCPVALLVPGNAPKVLACPLVESGQEGVVLVVVDDIEAVAVQDGRGARAPAHARLLARPGALPEFLALEVIAVQAKVAEVGVDALAVGD